MAGCSDCAALLLPCYALKTAAENSQIQGQREKSIAGHKQAQAELPSTFAVLAFVQRFSLKSKLKLMTQDMTIQG